VLLLGRKEGESIYLPTLGIEVKVIEICPYLVRLGIEAPRDVPILRDNCRDTKGIDLKTCMEVNDGNVPANGE
jgi:carbon storage regulator CsrA